MRTDVRGCAGSPRRRLAPLGWWLLLALCGAIHAAGGSESTLVRVASWNVLNYNLSGRMVEGRYCPVYPKPEAEKAALRRLLGELRPDVLLLQEMGPEPFLEELRRDLAREGCVYPYARVLESADRQRHLAILSRLRPRRWREFPVLPLPAPGPAGVVKRGCLGAEFSQGGRIWAVFTFHWKSPHETRRQAREEPAAVRRQREARALRELLRREAPPACLVLGDANEPPGGPALGLLLDPASPFPLALLPPRDPAGLGWSFFPTAERPGRLVDHALGSPAVWPLLVGESALLAGDRASRAASDHRPVYVDLRFPAEPVEPPAEGIPDSRP